MKTTTTFSRTRKLMLVFLLLLAAFVPSNQSSAQTSVVCTNPNTIIYGLTANGQIYGINTATGATSVVKNSTYSGNAPDRANGMGYNYVNKKFYYFKRAVGNSPQEFVSFEPLTNTVTLLASSTLA